MRNGIDYITPEEVCARGLDGGRELSLRKLYGLAVKNFRCTKCSNPAWKLMDKGLCVDCTLEGCSPHNQLELRCEPLSAWYGVEVKYLNQHEQDHGYTYLVDGSIELLKRDTVVVPVGKEGGILVARVSEVLPKPELKENIAYHWVIQKVDFTLYKQLLGSKK